MESIFSIICEQYLARRAEKGELPFVPWKMGKWWGLNPITMAKDEIDVLALDQTKTEGMFCKCKYRYQPLSMEDYDAFVTVTRALPEVTKRHLIFFSKSGYTEPVKERAEREGARLLTIEDLYEKV